MPRTTPQLLVPPEKVRRYLELKERLRLQEIEKARNQDVFELLEYVPTPKQAEFHAATEFDVLFGGSAGGGKMLPVSEQIPTPSGWIRMGDLRPGDEVFTETGATCRVTQVHPVNKQPVTYRLTFDDGTAMDSCADHQWLTFDSDELGALTRHDPEWRAQRRARRPVRVSGRKSELFATSLAARNALNPPPALPPPSGTVRTTKQIAETLLSRRGRTNHAIPVAGALDLPSADLPLDPYVLGAWLGDGHTKSAGFTTADPEILEHFRAAGITVTDVRTPARKYAYRLGDTVMQPRANARPGWVNTFGVALRALGVEGDKHIPSIYLRASTEQRLALLHGLMDTDGTVNQTGSVSFLTTKPRLADDVYELIVSLGWKVCRRERRAKLRGKDCGPVWSFKWTPDRTVFRLARKADKQVLATRRTTRFRYITGCEEVAPTPMRCITVDNPTHLYLAGRSMVPTHNSRALTAEGIRAAVRYPGLRIGAFRRTYPELEESLLAELTQMGYARALGATWNGTAHELRFPNGSLLMFRYAENIADATRRQGGQYQLLLFDERTLTPPAVISFLESRLRSGRADIPVLGIRSTSNPGGAGHGAVKKKYITATDHGTKVVTDERGRTVRFIISKLADNPHVNAEYASDLLSLDEKLRAAFLDGNWDVFAGQMFTGLDHDRHVVEPFTLPASWQRYNGIDWGFAKPWAVLWAAVDEDGRAWFYREIYKARVGESDQAKMILAAEAGDENVAVRYADDAMWATRGEQKPISDIYAENGVYLTEAGKGGRVPGWQRVRSYVKDGPACPHHRSLGWAECPMLHIFSTCPEFYRTLSDLPHATKGNPEDAATDGEDHLPDAARYLLINLGGGPSWPDVPPPRENPFDGIEPLVPHGPFAWRPDDDAPERDPKQGALQRSPWA